MRRHTLTEADRHHSVVASSPTCVQDVDPAWPAPITPDRGSQLKEDEHAAALRLTPACAATHVAVQSGRWGDPQTWLDRSVPAAGGRVLIPAAMVVDIDGVLAPVLEWVRVEGHLAFQPGRNTALAVRTLVVSDTGTLTIGTSTAPVQGNVKARLLFAPRGDRDRRGDPFDLAGGLISTGIVNMVGPRKTGHQSTTASLQRGIRRIAFASPPSGWKVGDQLLIPGTVFGVDEDEQRTIVGRSFDGRTLTLNRPLGFDHPAPAGIGVAVGNLSRNIEVASLAAAPLAARGHVMIRHVQTGTVFDGVAFLHLGRTDARTGHTHPAVGPDGQTNPLTDTNTIGRYAIHFHLRSGARTNVPPHVVRNSVVIDSPKYGVVNHGGHLVAEGNVTFRVVGAHFVAENGAEIGAFRRNMAVRSTGSGDSPIQSRMNVYDLGHAGHGVWLQGSGVEVTDNWVSGQADTGIVEFGDPFFENGQQVRFDPRNLPDADHDHVHPELTNAEPNLYMARNTVAGSKQGVVIWTHKLNSADDQVSVIEDLTVWNIQYHFAVQLAYAKRLVLRNPRLVGLGVAGTAGVGVNMFTGDITIDGGSIEGFDQGIQVPSRGRNLVRNTILANRVDVAISTAGLRQRYVHLDNPLFRDSTDPAHMNIQMKELDIPENGDLAVLFLDDRIDLTDKHGRNRRLFFPSQRPQSVPFWTGRIEALRGLTSAEIHEQFGMAPGGTLAPKDATPLTASNAVVAASPRYTVPQGGQPERLLGEGYSHQFEHFSRGTAKSPANGWTVMPGPSRGSKGRLVFVDSTPPKFMILNCLLPLRIHPDDLPFGYRVMGMKIDKVGEDLVVIAHAETFHDLKIDPDGFVRVSFKVVDQAGNFTRVDLALQVTPDAVRRGSNLEFFLQRTYCANPGIDTVQADARRYYDTGEWRVSTESR
jgi:hypothetical protein